jgi:hypothetical protein
MRRGVIGVMLLAAACAEASKSTNETAAPRSPDRSPRAPAQGELEEAHDSLAQAQHEVEAALLGGPQPGRVGQPIASDCTTACRALTSMERAAEHICTLSDAADCADARGRAQRARDQVIAACGACK